MQSTTKVMIADEDRLFTSLICSALRLSPEFSVVGVYHNCDHLLDAIRRLRPHVLLLDPMLLGADALLFLRRLNHLPIAQRPHIFVISSFLSSDMATACNHLGVRMILRKPVSAEAIPTLISSCVSIPRTPTHTPTESDIRLYITALLDDLQFPMHVLGYYYVRDCILLAVRSETPAISVTKELYPAVAKTYKTSWTSVERDIRTGVRIAWERCDGKFRGICAVRRPTNRAFIAAIAERVRTDLRLDFAYIN